MILGGLVAAVTGPLGLAKGSWLAAYLVLVCGVASCAIGAAQARSGPASMRSPRTWMLLGCWGAGNVAVIAGSLTAVPVVVDCGAALLVIALVLALADAGRSAWLPTRSGRLIGWTYRGMLVFLMISTLVGAVLAHLRSAT